MNKSDIQLTVREPVECKGDIYNPFKKDWKPEDDKLLHKMLMESTGSSILFGMLADQAVYRDNVFGYLQLTLGVITNILIAISTFMSSNNIENNYSKYIGILTLIAGGFLLLSSATSKFMGSLPAYGRIKSLLSRFVSVNNVISDILTINAKDRPASGSLILQLRTQMQNNTEDSSFLQISAGISEAYMFKVKTDLAEISDPVERAEKTNIYMSVLAGHSIIS
jgi:hypothetical protein